MQSSSNVNPLKRYMRVTDLSAAPLVITISATLLLAASAHVSLPLPFTPVPLTLQTFAVLLIGLCMGPIAGAVTLGLYLLEGLLGLPVFSSRNSSGLNALLGPTGGFLMACPLSAALTGWSFGWLKGMLRSGFAAAVVAGTLGTILIFALGAGWLALVSPISAGHLWMAAVAPFLPGEAIKIVAAAGIAASLRVRRG